MFITFRIGSLEINDEPVMENGARNRAITILPLHDIRREVGAGSDFQGRKRDIT
jgi:hypothetical protein